MDEIDALAAKVDTMNTLLSEVLTEVKELRKRLDTEKLIKATESLTGIVTTSKEIQQAKQEDILRQTETKTDVSSFMAGLREEYFNKGNKVTP